MEVWASLMTQVDLSDLMLSMIICARSDSDNENELLETGNERLTDLEKNVEESVNLLLNEDEDPSDNLDIDILKKSFNGITDINNTISLSKYSPYIEKWKKIRSKLIKGYMICISLYHASKNTDSSL